MILCPGGHLAMSGDDFGVTDGPGQSYWSLMVAAKHPKMHRTAQHNENLSGTKYE